MQDEDDYILTLAAHHGQAHAAKTEFSMDLGKEFVCHFVLLADTFLPLRLFSTDAEAIIFLFFTSLFLDLNLNRKGIMPICIQRHIRDDYGTNVYVFRQ